MPPPRKNRPAHHDFIARRREAVARLRLRGYSVREIVESLGRNADFLNPETGKPYGHDTIHKDIVAIRAEWAAAAAESITEHQEAQLAEIREARREAWKAKDLALVDRLISREMQLLGTKAPERAPIDEKGNTVKPLDEDATARLLAGAARILHGPDAS